MENKQQEELEQQREEYERGEIESAMSTRFNDDHERNARNERHNRNHR